MRLTDLNPVWTRWHGRMAVGIRFDCPLCRNCQLAVLFLNCPDGAPSVPDDPQMVGNNRGLRWSRSGLTFDDLTLNPSIDASSPDPGATEDIKALYRVPCVDGGSRHWHGFVRNGEIV